MQYIFGWNERMKGTFHTECL